MYGFTSSEDVNLFTKESFNDPRCETMHSLSTMKDSVKDDYGEPLKIIKWSRRLILSNNLRKFSPFHIRTYGGRARSFTTRTKKDPLSARVSFYSPGWKR